MATAMPWWKDIVWAGDKHGERRRSARLNTVQTFFQMNHKLLRSRRVVHKRELTQLQGQRQRQLIIMYIRVFLINLNCDCSNSLNFFNCRRIYSWSRVYDPIKRRVLILEVLRRSRAGTAKKNCNTQLDATKRKNGSKTENWQWIYWSG